MSQNSLASSLLIGILQKVTHSIQPKLTEEDVKRIKNRKYPLSYPLLLLLTFLPGIIATIVAGFLTLIISLFIYENLSLNSHQNQNEFVSYLSILNVGVSYGWGAFIALTVVSDLEWKLASSKFRDYIYLKQMNAGYGQAHYPTVLNLFYKIGLLLWTVSLISTLILIVVG